MTRGSFNDGSSDDGNGGRICTESQMMAMFGWTDPKMPAHYIAQANREKLGMSGMDEIVAFDQSQSLDDFMPPPSIVPNGDDQSIYLVVHDLGRFGRVWR